MEKYEPLGVVGEGSYGVVLKCRCRDNGRVVAIKKFIDSEDDQNVRKIALREIRVLRKLRHENLVNLIEVFRRRKHLYLVFEFIDHTLLDQLEQKSHGLDDETCRKYIFQILRGLGFCHDNNIIHRDVKPENVLVTKSGIVKLCDFGFARNLCAPGDVYTDYVATRWYRAPELLVGDVAYGKEVDIWAVGCLFAEMSCGEALFPGDSDIDQLFLIAQCLGRLAKRHLKIMARNSAFRGFKYPESRHGSTNSTSSTKFSKMGARSDQSRFSSTKQQNNSTSGKRRASSVEKSVFSSMFPSWSNEAVQFLSLCLDPEPAARPTCNGLLRLPYFTHDNFPSRFIAELNAKLQQEGRNPIPAYSTRKKRSLMGQTGANVASSVSPSHRPAVNNLASSLQYRNPLHQTRSNLAMEDNLNSLSQQSQLQTQAQAPINQPYGSSTTRLQLHSSNLLNHNHSNSHSSTNSNATPSVAAQQQNQLTPQQSFSMSRQQTFLVEKFNTKDKTTNNIGSTRRNSFVPSVENISPPLTTTNNFTPNALHNDSRIPVLLQRKHSDDMILLPVNLPLSVQNTSKSTPNISADEMTIVREKRYSMQSNMPSQMHSQLPLQIHKKFSYSFPTPSNSNNNSSMQEQLEDLKPLLDIGSPPKYLHGHLPITTLTFNLGPNGTMFQNGSNGNSNNSSSNGNSNNNAPYSFMNPLAKSREVNMINNISNGALSNGTSSSNNNFTLQKKNSPVTTKKKSTSIGVTNFLPQTNQNPPFSTFNGNHYQSQTIGNYQFQANPKSLPVSVFGSSMLRNSNNVDSFLPRMTAKVTGHSGSNGEEESLPMLSLGSPSKPNTSTVGKRKDTGSHQKKSGENNGSKNSNGSYSNGSSSSSTQDRQDRMENVSPKNSSSFPFM